MLTFDEPKTTAHIDGMRKHRWKRDIPTTRLVMGHWMVDTLKLLYQFKALRSSHIRMHQRRTCVRSVNETLRTLFDHGLIAKVDDLRRFNALYQHDVYTLTDAGLEALAAYDLPPRYVYLEHGLGIKLNREWDHSMMIIDLLSNLKAGADRAGIRMIAAEEIAKSANTADCFVLPRRSTYFSKKANKSVPKVMVPDGFVGFHYPDGRIFYYAVEAEHNKAVSRFDDFDERSTQSSTRKKLREYVDIDLAAVYQRLNIKTMQVLVVVPTAARALTVAREAKSVVKSSHLFKINWLPVVSGKDVPVVPDIFDTTWLRIGLPEEPLNYLLQ